VTNVPLSTVAARADIGPDEYELIRRTVYDHSRINLGAEKKSLVAARVTKRLRALNLPAFDIYCEYLKSSKGKHEIAFLVEAISTNHTYFFREKGHFDFLRETIVPQWRARAVNRIRIWSAACSSGEEPYSIAIVLAETLGFKIDWRIHASDISMRMLDVGRKAIYSADRLSHVPADFHRRCFQRGVGGSEGFFRVREELRKRVDFAQLNLLQPAYPFATEFDLIFLRNAMIYFDRDTQQTLVEKITPHLLRGGHLMIGHTENLTGLRHSLASVEPSIYQRA
jgi:chemotaxis protein methyltransferase CheR